MPSLFVQSRPYGFEVDAPSFWYWLQAGAGFAVGAGFIYIVYALAWVTLAAAAPGVLLIRRFAGL